jgi:tetratricopeptide (TPR) repeat protein
VSIWDLISRYFRKPAPTSVIAQRSSVAINGPNSAPVIINDIDTIAEALSKSGAVQYAALAQGVAGDLHTEFDRQIDHYREQMNSGAVRTALASFEKLSADQGDKLSDILSFRVKANIALCHYQLGNSAKAPNLLLEACTYAPNDKRSISFKALAYILMGDSDKALEYGSEKIVENPDNEILAGFILQATRIKYYDKENFVDPFDQFSERVKLNQSVRISHLHLLATRDAEGWRDQAQQFLEEFPDDGQVKNLIAMGILRHHVDNCQSTNGFRFTQKEMDELKLAADYMSADWQAFKESDRVAQDSDLQTIQNLLILYKLSNNIDALVRECSYVLSDLTDDQQIIETTARSLIDLQEDELFERAVDKVTDSANSKKLRFLSKVARKDWDALSAVQDYTIERFDSPFSDHAKVVVYIARAFVGQARGKNQLENLLSTCELDSRGRLLLFEFSTASEINSIAIMAHSYGYSRVNDCSETIEFLHYMRLVRHLMLWREIVARLESHSAATESHELKHMLALGFLNEHPIRREAVEFFEKHIISNPQGFELLAGCFYFKRNDFKKSAQLVRKYLEDGGQDLFAFIVLCDIAKLSNDAEMLNQLFENYELSGFTGSPEQWLHISKLRVSLGQGAEALAEAYQLLMDNPDSAPVALGFFGIFIQTETETILNSVTVVGNGCYYRLTPSEGPEIERTVEANTEDLIALTPEKVDFYTIQVWGKSAGYEFVQKKLQGDINWKLEEVKHPYLHAFHEICKSYETRFPTAGGLWALRVENDNIDALLAFMQKKADQDDTIFGEILDKQMPLEVACGISKKGIFDIYDLVRSKAGMINTCTGTKEERQIAMSLVETYQDRPVVLDTYAIRAVAELGLMGAFNTFFSSVIVPHSTMQTLQMLSVDIGGLFGQATYESMQVQDVINEIREGCEIVEHNFPRELDELTDKLLEINPDSLAPYFIANKLEALFISEDHYSRGFAANIYHLNNSTWLQPVLNVMLQRRVITLNTYSQAMLGLAARKHGFLSVGLYLLENAYTNDTSPELSQVSTLCNFIGGPQAELESHFQIILQFIMARWLIDYNPHYDLAIETLLLSSHGEAFPSAKAMKATSMLLDKLIEIPGGRRKLNELMVLPILRLNDFIIGWWRGHFYK